MKTAFVFLISGLLLAALAFYRSGIWFRSDSVTLHFSDTYLVVSYLPFACVIALFALNLFSVGGVLGTGFRSKGFLLVLLLALLLDAALWWYLTNMNPA